MKHARSLACTLKPALEASVRSSNPVVREMQRDLDRLDRTVWSVRACARRVEGHSPIRPRPELPGVKLATYSTKGLLRERGNRDPSAGASVSGKPPSPAMSRTRGGAVVCQFAGTRDRVSGRIFSLKGPADFQAQGTTWAGLGVRFSGSRDHPIFRLEGPPRAEDGFLGSASRWPSPTLPAAPHSASRGWWSRIRTRIPG